MVAAPPADKAAQPSRRTVLRSVAAVVGAAAWPRPGLAQWPKISEISQASLNARRDIGRLVWQADNLLRQTVADGDERAAAAVRRFRAERAAISRNMAALLNSRVSEDDWPLLVPPSQIELQLAMQPLAIRLAPSEVAVEAAVVAPLPKITPGQGDDLAAALLALIFDCLGVNRGGQNLDGLVARLKADAALRSAFDNVSAALRSRRYGIAAFEIERLMRLVTGPASTASIAELLGKDGLRTVYAGIVLYFVPFAGWGYFTAYVLASIYDSREALGPLLR
jgi:hypothetical protein